MREIVYIARGSGRGEGMDRRRKRREEEERGRREGNWGYGKLNLNVVLLSCWLTFGRLVIRRGSDGKTWEVF